MATMADVARSAGVSVATVSHVLNDTRPVLPHTRQAVLDAVDGSATRPNTLARSLVTSRTRSIGLAVSAISNPYFTEILQGVEAAALEHGYSLLIADPHDDPGARAQGRPAAARTPSRRHDRRPVRGPARTRRLPRAARRTGRVPRPACRLPRRRHTALRPGLRREHRADRPAGHPSRRARPPPDRPGRRPRPGSAPPANASPDTAAASPPPGSPTTNTSWCTATPSPPAPNVPLRSSSPSPTRPPRSSPPTTR